MPGGQAQRRRYKLRDGEEVLLLGSRPGSWGKEPADGAKRRGMNHRGKGEGKELKVR
jgi:hypothetical protein